MTRRSLCFVFVSSITAVWAAPQAFDGTWQLNTAKSKTTGPGWKSRTLTIAADGENRRFKSEGVSTEGQQISGGYEGKTDGKDHPVTGSLAGADTIALRQQSDRVITFTLKKGGKTIATGRSTVSADGKTMTTTSKGTTADGKSYTSTAVYDKQ